VAWAIRIRDTPSSDVFRAERFLRGWAIVLFEVM
jgi:hypothetical protein